MPLSPAQGLRRRARLAAAAVLAAALAGASAPPARAQDSGSASTNKAGSPSWTVTCTSDGASPDLACTLSQVILLKDSGQRVLTVSIAKEQGKFTLRLALPHGLDLQKGVEIWIDGGARAKFPIATADQKGSYAIIPVSEGLLAGFKAGTQFNVAMTAFAGKEFVVQVALAGFSAGFAKL